MTDATNMRSYLKLFEAAAPDYVGPKASDSISYSAEQTKGVINKVTSFLKSYDSGRYTKLGRNLLRITKLKEELKTLEAETKQDARELVADLFHAEDAACTRVVDTVGFVFHMSKDPEAVGSVSYAKVLKELETHLTPELISVMEGLKAKHTSAPVQKAASLKATDKSEPVTAEESLQEGISDKLKGFFGKVFQEIKAWGVSYDSKLDALKAEIGMTESIEEADLVEFTSKENYDEGDLVLVTKDDGTTEYGHIEDVAYNGYKVNLYKSGGFTFVRGDQLQPATHDEAKKAMGLR